MKNYEELSEYDLLTKVYLVETGFSHRQGAFLDGYRGQFFWHINDVNCSDWDAAYVFEFGLVNPGEKSKCKVVLSENVKNTLKMFFQLSINLVLESKVKNA